jgi:SAM-dependent methyltransferase
MGGCTHFIAKSQRKILPLKRMSTLGLLLIFIMLMAFLTLPFYYYKRPKKTKKEAPALYAEVYDKIHSNPERFAEEMAELSLREEAYVLDVGCGTGNRVGSVDGAVGIDLSVSMVELAKKKYPTKSFLVGDVLQKDTFDKETFTDIWCLGNTVFTLQSKYKFLQNAHYWLDPNGRLVLQILDRDQLCAPTKLRSNFKYDMRRYGNTCRERVSFGDENAVVETRFYMISKSRLITMAERIGFTLEKTKKDLYFFKKSSI